MTSDEIDMFRWKCDGHEWPRTFDRWLYTLCSLLKNRDCQCQPFPGSAATLQVASALQYVTECAGDMADDDFFCNLIGSILYLTGQLTND